MSQRNRTEASLENCRRELSRTRVELVAAEQRATAALSFPSVSTTGWQVLPVCGIEGKGYKIGCGEPIATIEDLYRCVTCAVPFHEDCLRAHFNHRDDFVPSPSNVERVVMAEAAVVGLEQRADDAEARVAAAASECQDDLVYPCDCDDSDGSVCLAHRVLGALAAAVVSAEPTEETT